MIKDTLHMRLISYKDKWVRWYSHVMYAVKTYRKAVHFYTRKVLYKYVSTRGQARKLFCFLTRLISCRIFFLR